MKLSRVLMAMAVSICLSLPMWAAPQEAGQAPAKGQQRMGRREGREAHPAIRAAIQALERAKADLQHASHDFGGHREDALKACDQAIQQLRQALQYDKE
jgi:cysteine sulfinate desulfinase/cysteine desulfurase-like protein